MPKIAVEIEWDWPDEPFWLNADNVALALHAHCKNTKFVVRDVEPSDAIELSDEITERLKGKCQTGHIVKPRCISCTYYEPGDDEILVFTTKKITGNKFEVSDCDALCQRLPERVVSEIHQAVGQASTCWENLDSMASFDSEQASSIANDLCNFIADFLDEGKE